MIYYDLHCEACDTISEVQQTPNAKGPFVCPKCGAKKARRVILRAPAFHAHYSPMNPRVNRGRGY